MAALDHQATEGPKRRCITSEFEQDEFGTTRPRTTSSRIITLGADDVVVTEEPLATEAKDVDRRAAGIEICSTAAAHGRKRVAIIGASSAGMIQAKELIDAGNFDVVLFEQKRDVGGVYSSKASYKGSALTGSCSIVCYGCFPSGEEHFPTYWEIPKYAQYLERFADHFKLRQLIRFGTTIRRIDMCDGSHVSDAFGNKLVAITSAPVEDSEAEGSEELFHHLIVCTGITGSGHNLAPIPEWSGLKSFKGQVLHSNQFTDAKDFSGRKVLVVGLGESGSDIALLLCKAGAESVCIQSRKGPGYVVPRMVMGRAADLDTSRCYHSIPYWLWGAGYGWRRFKLWVESFYLTKDDNVRALDLCSQVNNSHSRGIANPKRRFGTKNESFAVAVVDHGALYKQSEIFSFQEDRVVFADNSEFECDTVVYCGGYKIELPDIKRAASASNDEKILPRDMYKRIVHPDLGLRVCFVGMFRPAFGAIPPASEMQARLLTLWLSGKKELPSKEVMTADIERNMKVDLTQYEHDGERIKALGDFSRWMSEWAREIGCEPRLTKLFFTDPRLWWHVLFGQLNGMQFRLHGPQAVPGIRESIVSMPMMPSPVIMVSGMVMAFCKVASLVPGGGRFKLTC